MTKNEMIETLKTKARNLLDLLENPEPGLFTWNAMVGQTLSEIAELAPEKPKPRG